MVIRLFALFFTLVLGGCAATALQPDVASDIREAKVAVAVYVEDKKINYGEMVYKVLWNETRAQQAAFQGIWDVDKELTDLLTGELQQVGIDGHPVTTALSDEAYAKFGAAIQAAHDKDGMNLPIVLHEDTRNQLRNNGFQYLVLLRSSGFLVQTTSVFDIATMNVPASLIVYEVESNTVEYNEPFGLVGNIGYEESVREIEDNNLAKIKESTKTWLRALTQRHFPTIFGADNKS